MILVTTAKDGGSADYAGAIICLRQHQQYGHVTPDILSFALRADLRSFNKICWNKSQQL
jgi:hypothetical protein